MNITSKSRYALKIMMDLAYYSRAGEVVRRLDIANRQGVPTDYLDQIMMKLRSGGLVVSVRGRSGGYRLGRAAEKISVWDLFSCVEDNVVPVSCVVAEHSCGFESHCVSKDAWTEIFAAMQGSLGAIDIAGLVSRWGNEQKMIPASGPRECRSGSKHTEIVFPVVASGPVEVMHG